MNMTALTHLQRLEAESIHILREVAAEAENPVMLYSVGKDSAVMLHLAKKAFYPAPPPFPLLHVDTTWKFQEMYALRDRAAKEAGMQLLVHQNPEAVRRTTVGTPRTSARNSGGCTMLAKPRAKACGFSRFRTGLNWISGSTSILRGLRSFPFISRRHGPLLRATV